jgi:hypothetical protein
MEVPMTSALRMSLGPLFSALILASPAAAGRHPQRVVAQRPADAGECLGLASRDEVVAGALRSLLLAPAGRDREIGAVRLSGVGSFAEEAL